MYRNVIKRILDIAICLVLLLPVLVLVAIVSIAIIVTDGRPVFYNAERIGQGGKIFKMYKFRSMHVDAPDLRLADGSTYNGANDPRVTMIGRILRESSLDEVPQFFNVLNGTMSLIGPRPDTPKGAHKFPEHEKYFLQVKPGITGYSQAFFRNTVDWEQKAKNDSYYAQNVSFLFDVKIFLKTIQRVFSRTGTYKQVD